MIALKDKYRIPAWISCRTYFFGEENSRTYIANEKNHTYIQLDGLASDMWKMLYDNIDDNNFNKWTQDNQISEQVEDFINELIGQNLLLSVEQKEIENSLNNSAEEGRTLNDDNKFVEEMQAWLYNNKFMFSLFFELTYRCDLKCVHCYNPKHMSNVEIDLDICKKAIDDAYDIGCFRVTFSGGEATLHSKFLELVKYVRSKHMSVEIFTNGQTLNKNEKLYRELISLHPYRVCVSLYSTEEEMHEKVTDVKGSFNNTFSIIKKLTADNVSVQIKNFLLNFNCMDCLKVKQLAEKIQASSIADISLIPTIEGDKKTMQFVLKEDDLFALYTDINSPLYIGDNFKKIPYNDIKEQTPCLAGLTSLCINPKGDVTICVSMPYLVGSLSETSLYEIWNSAMDKNEDSKLYQWQQIKISDLKECFKEDYCQFCHYCPGMGYLENGYLKHSDVLCKQAQVKMQVYNFLRNK